MSNQIYECYSYNVMKFMEKHSQFPVSEGRHSKSKMQVWVFKRNPRFNVLLGLYTEEGKRKKEAN